MNHTKDTSSDLREKIQNIVATPFLHPPLDNIKGSELRTSWDWQIKQIEDLVAEREALAVERGKELEMLILRKHIEEQLSWHTTLTVESLLNYINTRLLLLSPKEGDLSEDK